MKAVECTGCRLAIRASNADVLRKRLKRHVKQCAVLAEIARAMLRESAK